MKKSLGKTILILLILFTCSQAKDLASYSLSANKTTVYEKEAFIITFDAIQKDHTDNMMFLVKPIKSKDYKILLLNKKINDKKYHNTHTTFTYLLFPLKPKILSINFDFTIQTASNKAIAHSYVDDHDDSIAIQTYNTKIDIKPLHVEVKKLDRDVDLVGDFHLSERIHQTQINQYESLDIIYTLEGEGYEDKNFQPIKNIKNVTIFTETNDIYSSLTKKGHKIEREYIYAFSAKEDFIIPKLVLEAYSPSRKKYYTLKTPEHKIKVKKVDISKLLDNEESPISKEFIQIDKIKQFFIYILIFISGYFSAKFQTLRFKKRKKSKEYLNIKNTHKAKELLFIIINTHKEIQFAQEVKMLEDIVYNKKMYDFNKIKFKILKGVK